MALDNETAAFLQHMAEARPSSARPIWEMQPADAREAGAGLRDLYGAGPEMYRIENHELDAFDGGTFRVRVLVPSESPAAVLVYLHGGGWVLEDIDGYDTLGRTLAERSGTAVILVEYRKAPEFPFPTPVEDSWTALRWAAEQRLAIAGDNVPLWVAGDSSGGNLAAVLTQRARDFGGPDLEGQILIYPVTDADLTRSSYLDPANQVVIDADTMRWFWNHYAPDEDARKLPEVSPLRAESLQGLPDALIITAEHDVLRDEGEAYAHRLTDHGVTVQYHRWPGQMHLFFSLVNVLPASSEAIELVASHLRGRARSEADGRMSTAVLRKTAQ
ncbi:acetyl esterase [Arthrobacter sp. SLBN-100]|uniref:alpha/beta hydrolase n=1 Tax=Arthrobacter sp. SLBN-100 TaxID=2768450 RepID=UPI00114DC826|nr:alpha/beta hydrolase [Arthrobacter sp. SLBN-100]TQJ62070.1 acetyl esterase [Arthrobacter sp. SLBN-100]